MSERQKITEPGRYTARCVWAGHATVGKKQTPAIKLLLVDDLDRGIYGTVWMTDKAKSGEYMNRIKAAFGITEPTPENFRGKSANIIVEEENGFLNVVAYQPVEPPTQEPEPPMPTDEYLDSIHEPEDDQDGKNQEDIPF